MVCALNPELHTLQTLNPRTKLTLFMIHMFGLASQAPSAVVLWIWDNRLKDGPTSRPVFSECSRLVGASVYLQATRQASSMEHFRCY